MAGLGSDLVVLVTARISEAPGLSNNIMQCPKKTCREVYYSRENKFKCILCGTKCVVRVPASVL